MKWSMSVLARNTHKQIRLPVVCVCVRVSYVCPHLYSRVYIFHKYTFDVCCHTTYRQQNKHPAHQVAQPNQQQLEKFALHIGEQMG